jgi:2-hydroxycyclohexanecarboxyl-CoA dehydrogenase
VPYSASKAALIGFSRALARELGPHGITVNCVAPGPIDTDSMIGRVGTVAEVAALMAFLLGQDAGYITAATYDINGGLQVS